MSKLKTIRAYLAAKYALSQIEKEMKELKPMVEEILKKEPDQKLSVDDATLCLSEVHREHFDLKSAKEKLKERLSPFLSDLEYSQIRVTYKATA